MLSANFFQKNFKIRFVLSFCLIVFTAAVVSGFILYIITYRDIGAVYSQGLNILMDVGKLIVPAITITVIFQTIIISIAVALIALFVSHKMVGPIYRLGSTVKNIYTSRDLTATIKFRKTDPIEQLADIFNCMTASLCQRIEKLEQGLLRINDIEKQLEGIIDADSIAKNRLEAAKKPLEHEIAEIKKLLSGFKTD